MSYKVSTPQKSLVVFSEVYYGNSWHAYIDGEPVPHLRANYILRALPVDAGEHIVEFEFSFRPADVGGKISYAGSVIIILILLGSLLKFTILPYIRKEDKSAPKQA
jgi:hypothetical protein